MRVDAGMRRTAVMLLAGLLVATAPRPAVAGGPVACGSKSFAAMPPGDALQALDDFRAGLAAADRVRLDGALPRDPDGGLTQCDKVEGSRASCEVAAYMPALRTRGLLPKFLAGVCQPR